MFKQNWDSDKDDLDDGGELSAARHLIGARVEEITYSDACEEFLIQTDRGVLTLLAEADCCSSSWFQAFDNWSDLIGQVIVAIDVRIEERDESDNEPCRQDVTSLYGAVFSYAGGSAYLELRNDSNGYYGGEVRVGWKAKG